MTLTNTYNEYENNTFTLEGSDIKKLILTITTTTTTTIILLPVLAIRFTLLESNFFTTYY